LIEHGDSNPVFDITWIDLDPKFDHEVLHGAIIIEAA